MITVPTVLILGAGASHPYGFPLGRDLVKSVLLGLRGQGTVLKRDLGGAGGCRPGDLDDFGKHLLEAVPGSVDEFLENNREEFIDIGRKAIATIIVRRSVVLQDAFNSETKRTDRWYDYLWREMRSGTSLETLKKNKLSVVTFNYDCSLEWFLARTLSASFNVPEAKAREILGEVVPIVHVHGSVGWPRLSVRDSDHFSTDDLTRLASDIHIVHDEIDAEKDACFQEAHGLIANAQNICFLGFGYHSSNVRRLNVAGHAGSASLFGTVRGMGKREVGEARRKVNRDVTFHDGDILSFLRDTSGLYLRTPADYQ